jgi:hypothetical protein
LQLRMENVLCVEHCSGRSWLGDELGHGRRARPGRGWGSLALHGRHGRCAQNLGVFAESGRGFLMEMERLANGEILTFSGKVLKLTSGNVRTVILSGSGKMGRRCLKM